MELICAERIARLPQLGNLFYCALDLSIPIILQEPQTIHQLCENTSVIPEKLERVMLALESNGLFNYDQNSQLWSNNEATLPFADQDKSTTFMHFVCPMEYSLLSQTLNCLKVETSASHLAFNKPVHDALNDYPKYRDIYQNTMAIFTRGSGPMIKQALDLSNTKKLLDVGGSNGTLITCLLKDQPGISGAVLDIPEVVESARANIAEQNMQSRIGVIAGNALEEIPSGFDSIIMKYIIHDWNDEDSLKILRNCREALGEGGNLFIVEMPCDKSKLENRVSRNMNVRMMIYNNAMERTLEEYVRLLEKASFKLSKVVPAGEMQIIHSVGV